MGNKNIYYAQAYRCEACGKNQKHYIWSKDIETAAHLCPTPLCNAAVDVNCLYDDEPAPAPKVGKLNQQQVHKDRRIRSKQHFQREILPTLGRDEKRHFGGKGYKV